LDLADYDAAYLHLQELATLPPVSNQNDSDLLAKRYLLARLECLLMRGQMEAARTLLADGRNEIQDSETMARCYLLLLQYFRSCGQWQDAVQAGQQALAILDSPRSQLTRWMEWWEYGGLRWCGRYWSVLGQQSKLENIINQGLKIDLRAGLKAEIFFAMLLPLEELGNHTMLQKITQSLWDMSLRYEPYRFTVHGLIWASGGLSHDKISDLRQLKNMVNLSKVIHERFGELQDECELNLRRILTLSHWFTTWPAMTEDLDKTIDIGIESGDIYNAARAAYHRLSWSLHERIDTLLQRCPEWVDTVEAGNCQGLSLMMRLMIQKYKCLAGCTVRADSLSDKDFDEEEFVELLGSLSNKRLAFVYSLIKAELLYHASQSERALTYINHAWDLRHVVQGQPYIPYLRLYRSLIAADLVYKRRMEKRMAFNIMRQDIRCFRNWSTNNEYYLPLFLLLKAEHAFLRSSSDAEAFYDRAIAAAHDEKMSWLLALIHERAAMMLWDGGKKKLAGIYFNDAISLYEKWGAVGKAQHMIDDLAIQGMSDLAAPHKSEVETGYRSDWWSLQKRGTEGFGNEQLLEALRELASEPQSELLIDKFLRQVLLAANADKVLLIGKQSAKDSFRVFSLTATDHSSEVERGEISEFGQKFPRKVFEYTKNTHRSVVLADARNDRLFASDPYIIESEARSILCWPYIYNGSFQGAVYVENRLTDDIFEPALVDVLTILTTQTFLWLAHLGYWSQLDCEFQEQRRQLQSRSRLLDHMWQYTGCEGFVIDQGGTLSSLTSPAIKSWLTMKKLWRVPFWSVLFEESEANKFDQERVRQVLTECIGADVEHFNRQQHLLPTRMRRFVGRSSYQYHLRWEPLIDHAGEVDKIVVYVSSSDCTAQKGGVADMSEWLTEIDHKVA
jgi:GAF domain-containing protein